MSSRYQRSSVCGVTMNEANRSRESARPRRREEHPIPIAKLRPADRPSEHLHLVAEDGVLELELGDAPTSGERHDEPDERDVDEGSQGAREATYQCQSERNRVLDPHSPDQAFQ